MASAQAVPSQVAIRLHVADRRLDGGTSSEFLLDLAVDAALVAVEKHPERLRRVVAAVALVDVEQHDLREINSVLLTIGVLSF